MISRRRTLKLIGGGVVLAAAGAGGFVVTHGPSEAARQPWRHAGRYSDYRMRALSYALLAPNPHNRQPWLVKLEGDDAMTLYCDLDRRLPVTDPYDRQITIGCGAFLELLSIAAAEDGYEAVITSFPDGEDMTSLDQRPVAHVKFVAQGAQADPLFEHVLARRSNKTPYLPKDVPTEALKALQKSGERYGVSSVAVGNTDLSTSLRDLIWRAHYREMTTQLALDESVHLMRLGAAEVSKDRDGIELEGPLIEAGKIVGMISRDSLGDQSSEAFRQGLSMYEEMARSARAFGWLSNANDTRVDQISAGRAYLRFNLTAVSQGLAIHPWSQSLQEYVEMHDLYDEVHELIGGGERIQMLVRIGYADPVIPTPRRGLDAHIV